MPYTKWTEEEVQRRIREGYGKGTLQNYKEWFREGDFPAKKGFKHRQPCLTVGGPNDKLVLAEAELRFFKIADLSSSVVDIRTQHPEPRALTRRHAAEMRIRHPKYPGTDADVVLTLDALITVRYPGRQDKLVAVHAKKDGQDFEDPNVQNKLEISRRVWTGLNTPWFIATEAQVSEEVYQNALWLLDGIQIARVENHTDDWYEHVFRQASEEIVGHSESTIGDACARVDHHFGYKRGSASLALRWKMIRAVKLPALKGTLIPLRLCDMLESFNTSFHVIVGRG